MTKELAIFHQSTNAMIGTRMGDAQCESIIRLHDEGWKQRNGNALFKDQHPCNTIRKRLLQQLKGRPPRLEHFALNHIKLFEEEVHGSQSGTKSVIKNNQIMTSPETLVYFTLNCCNKRIQAFVNCLDWCSICLLYTSPSPRDRG